MGFNSEAGGRSSSRVRPPPASLRRLPAPAWLVPPSPTSWCTAWNTFATAIDEDLMKATADLMVKLGLKDVGWVPPNSRIRLGAFVGCC